MVAYSYTKGALFVNGDNETVTGDVELVGNMKIAGLLTKRQGGSKLMKKPHVSQREI